MTARFLFTSARVPATPPLPSVERWAIVLVALLALFPTWLRGGTHAAWTWPLPWIAVGGWLVWLVVFSRPTVAKGRGLIPWRDPVFWFAFLFVILLGTQWWNSGRALYFDGVARQWSYSAPRHPSLPSAITTGEARQMLDWFVPAWILLAVLRSPVIGARSIRAIWRIMSYSAGLLALFGMVQFISGTTNMYWMVPMRPHFFASFGYPNHAGSYFLLMECLTAGLLIHEVRTSGLSRRLRLALLGVAFLLSLFGANFALSRASILLSWALLLPIIFFAIAALWQRFDPARRVNLVMASLAVLTLIALLTFGLGRDAIQTEFKPEDDQKTFVDRETNFRLFQLQTSFQMWRDNPLFGVGGWGYRYLMAHYLTPDQWHRVTEGKANVHNDPMQFLAEFGIVGGGLMTATVALLWISTLRRRIRYPALFVLPALGVMLLALQSLIDLPFRSPAVLYLWLIVLAGLRHARPLKGEERTANQLIIA